MFFKDKEIKSIKDNGQVTSCICHQGETCSLLEQPASMRKREVEYIKLDVE